MCFFSYDKILKFSFELFFELSHISLSKMENFLVFSTKHLDLHSSYVTTSAVYKYILSYTLL